MGYLYSNDDRQRREYPRSYVVRFEDRGLALSRRQIWNRQLKASLKPATLSWLNIFPLTLRALLQRHALAIAC